ncbi:MAG: hypothetical protein JJE17_03575 [Peptostreptococcaceae bacterium]|nr:hypothetical protein [Peptostreptococcaceae bacterium]
MNTLGYRISVISTNLASEITRLSADDLDAPPPVQLGPEFHQLPAALCMVV